MAPRIPSRPGGNPKPTGDDSLLELLWEHFFGDIPILGDLFDMFDGTYSGGGVGAAITGFFSTLKGRVTDVEAGVDAVAGEVTGLENRVTDLESGGQVTAFASSGSWPIPETGFVTFSVINGGGAGATASGDNGGAGGNGGGFISQPFACADLRALGTTASFTIGAGASASNLQAGGISKVMIGTTNILVGVATPRGNFGSAIGTGGAVLVNGHATAGGRGTYYVDGTTMAGDPGESSGVAAGGSVAPVSGTGVAGGDGNPGPDLTYALAGGTGGGGGNSGANFATSGRGGDGGSPGGAGGGAGHARNLGASSGRRGYGANGAGMAYWQPTL